MKRTLVTWTVAGLGAIALALSSYTATFKTTYKPKSGTALAKAGCMLCHTGKMGGPLNGYGNDVKKQTKGAGKLTAAMLKKIEKLDSDKDGKTNIAEIKAGTLPGKK